MLRIAILSTAYLRLKARVDHGAQHTRGILKVFTLINHGQLHCVAHRLEHTREGRADHSGTGDDCTHGDKREKVRCSRVKRIGASRVNPSRTDFVAIGAKQGRVHGRRDRHVDAKCGRRWFRRGGRGRRGVPKMCAVGVFASSWTASHWLGAGACRSAPDARMCCACLTHTSLSLNLQPWALAIALTTI
jgi:hypothetical protein